MKGKILSNATPLSGILLLVLSLAFSSLSPWVQSTASAASFYDGVINPITELTIYNQYNSSEVSDISTNYMQYITGDAANYTTCDTACKDYINEVLQSDTGGWFVSQSYGGHTIYLTFFKTDYTFEFTQTGGYDMVHPQNPASFTDRVDLMIQRYGNNYEVYDADQFCIANRVTGTANNVCRPFVFNANMEYPVDYAGEELPTTAGPLPIARPDLKACINVRMLTITDKSEPQGDVGKIKYLITQGTFETQVYFFEQDVETGQEIRLDLPTDEPISIQSFYLDQSDAIKGDTDTLDFREANVTLTLDIPKCIDTTNEDIVCDENDHCTGSVEDKYPDCTEHNFLIKFWDTGVEWSIPSPTTIGCAVGQFWQRIADVFAFIVDTSDDPIESPFGNYTTDTHGLTSIISAPIAVFINMTNSGYTCDPVALPFPNIGNITLPCMYDTYNSMFGAMFVLYQTIISGVISYWVIVKYLEWVKSLKNPEDDRIEVADL